MKKRIIYLIVTASVLYLAACLPQTIQKGQSAKPITGQKQDKAQKTPEPTVAKKPAESLGSAGGRTPEVGKKANVTVSPRTELEANYESIAAEKIFSEGYKKADDKLAYLLAYVDSPYAHVAYQVAKELGKYDDPRSREALQRLSHHPADLDLPIAGTARDSLGKLESNKDMQKLMAAETPQEEREEIVRKYAAGTNRYAKGYIFEYLAEGVKTDPEKYVPLMVENFTYYSTTLDYAKQYPELAEKGLEKCLSGMNAVSVGFCIRFIGQLGNKKFMQRIDDIAYSELGSVDYTNSGNSVRLRSEAIYAYSFFGVESIPYLEKILFSKFDKDKLNAISILRSYGTNDALNVLKRYLAIYEKSSVKDNLLLDKLRAAIKQIEESHK